MLKRLLCGVVMAGSMAVSSASNAITVSGITWNEASILDFSAFSVAIRQFINPTTGELSGFGVVSRINDNGSDYAYCAAGVGTCELTFQFDGYLPNTPNAIPGAVGQTLTYSGGNFRVYADSSPEVTSVLSMTSANTGDGVLWLSMSGHPISGATLLGSVLGSLGGGVSSLSGQGILDIVGGTAAPYLNTNTKSDGADFTFSSSFTSFLTPGSLLDAAGTGNLAGDSVTIPLPGLALLFGVGLLGLGRRLGRKPQ